ncbi:MAG: APC family permease [Nitrospirae bacterium]|nr:APC family permease [Nitrospirota bacterium]
MDNSVSASTANGEPKQELRRNVTIWGSYMWGFADVGADSYVALGLVMAYVQGATGLAFALAGIVYIFIGLAYTELASAYPVSGGGPYYCLRGLGDFWGFIAGSALMLDYTIDIALFAVASAGYINFFLPSMIGHSIEYFAMDLGPFHHVNPLWCIESLVIIGLLIALNIKGVRESSLLNEVLGGVTIAMESLLVIIGFVFAWKPDLLVDQWVHQFPSFHNFMYGSSLAIISFVGLESISQAAQETRRPATIIPRTSITLVFSVFIFALSLSILGLGVLPWQEFAKHLDNPVAVLAGALPIIGPVAGILAALLGAIILFISSNAGIMGASRLAYSMSQFKLISGWFDAVHPRYYTPVRTIFVFSMVAVIQTFLSFLSPSAMDTLGNMYAFGATLGYTMVFIAMIKLRFSDPYSPRPYRMPLNLKWNYKGKTVYIPVLAFFGMLGVGSILFEVILTHAIGRIAGPAWILLCFGYYVWYRKKMGLPVFKSVERDWEKEQIMVLTSAEEFELVEEYKSALAGRDKLLGVKPK